MSRQLCTTSPSFLPNCLRMLHMLTQREIETILLTNGFSSAKYEQSGPQWFLAIQARMHTILKLRTQT